MKREVVNVIAGLGLLLLGAAVILGLLTGVLFLFPQVSILGAKAVNERSSEIIYRDPTLTAAFEQGRFILESTGVQIEVRMVNAGHPSEGTIAVYETATGIAFNSLSRTLVEWTQTLYNGEKYYRIKVLEPSGVVFSQNTMVYINLPHRDPTSSFRHNFVLQNHYSTVNFAFNDTKPGTTDALRINDLVVESAEAVNVPANEYITINNVKIQSNNTKFNCQATVLNNVTVTGSNGTQTFAKINGNVTVSGDKGDNNKFRGDTAADVNFTNKNGSLTMNQVRKLTVDTTNAIVTVGNATGKADVTTKHGDLRIRNLTGDLEFTAGSVDAPKPKATANVEVSSQLVGNVTIRNYGTGKINLSGVDGDVWISSYEVDGGTIDVKFASTAGQHSTKIIGYDGNINVKGINGNVYVEVRNWKNGAGAANIKLQYNKVVGESYVYAGGYVSGRRDWGNVDVELVNTNGFNMYVYGASSANSSSIYGYDKNNMKISSWDIDDYNHAQSVSGIANAILGGGAGHLHIYSKQSVYLH